MDEGKLVIPIGFAITMGLTALWSHLEDRGKDAIDRRVAEIADKHPQYGDNNGVLGPAELQGVARQSTAYVLSLDDLSLSQKEAYIKAHQDVNK